MLLKAGGKVDVINNKGTTLLQIAKRATKNDADKVLKLLNQY